MIGEPIQVSLLTSTVIVADADIIVATALCAPNMQVNFAFIGVGMYSGTIQADATDIAPTTNQRHPDMMYDYDDEDRYIHRLYHHFPNFLVGRAAKSMSDQAYPITRKETLA